MDVAPILKLYGASGHLDSGGLDLALRLDGTVRSRRR
jgi:hypothetical protein